MGKRVFFIPICSEADLIELVKNTLNYFDEDGNFVIAPNKPEFRAEKRAWELREFGHTDEDEQEVSDEPG